MKTKVRQEVEVTYDELVTVLMNVKVHQPCFVELHTIQDMLKGGKENTNQHFGLVKKISKCRYFTGSSYEDRVKNNMIKEGLNPDTFIVDKPTGKTHISKCVLKKDSDETILYFQIERFKEILPKNEWFFEGNPIDKGIFQNYLKKTYDSTKQEQERKVYPLTPFIKGIKSITMNRVRYTVV